MNIESPQTLTVDGREYPVAQFSETVQRLVAIHTKWRNDLQEERLNVAKTEAALRALDAELAQTVAAELQAQTAGEATDQATAETPSTA